MKIPYANCNFVQIRTEGYFYVDKTPYLPLLENMDENHLIFLRPRRFGKSTLISTLMNYYDVNKADKFDELFRGLWIYENPTPKKNQYLILRFDFSPVDSTGTEAQIQKSFATQVKASVWAFSRQYLHLIPTLSEFDGLLGSDEVDVAGIMTKLLKLTESAGRHVYLLIDEYDHFGNRLLSDGRDDVYQGLVRATGFVRSFYAALKAFTLTETVARTFITGVSPIMLDDLSSGFNIIKHISQKETFHALSGFTRADVERAIDTLLHDKPELAVDPRIGDRASLMNTLERYYNGYRFARRAAEKIYNSTLVLYFLSEVKSNGYYPNQMLDLNVRTDYGRLYQIARATSEKDTDTRDLLEEILTHESISVTLVEQFGTRMNLGRAQIASLLYYMGMLTFAEETEYEGEATLVIPNRVMRELQWQYMAFALEDHDGIRFDAGRLPQVLRKLAHDGDVQPLIDLFHKEVVKRLGLRETINFNEQTMKLMLFAYFSQTQAFYLMTEKELAQGYCDLLLGLRSPHTKAKYAWIIEAKYVKTDADETTVNKNVADGLAQIERYASDPDLVAMLTQGKELKAGVLVFVGLKDVFFRAWDKN